MVKKSFLTRTIEQIKKIPQTLGIKAKPTIELTNDQIKNINDFITLPEHQKPHGVGTGASVHFWYMWEILPQHYKNTMIYLMDSLPTDPKNYRTEISAVLNKYNFKTSYSETFFDLIINAWYDKIKNSSQTEKFSDWVIKNSEAFNKKINTSEISLVDLQQKHLTGLKHKLTTEIWNSYGVNPLSVKEENGSHFIEIQNTWYNCKIRNDTIRILVPTHKIKRAAWNPLYSAVLAKKAAEGVKPMKEYPAFLASDAYFYLTDGNHRFKLDTRDEVWVEMSYPAKTASYRISFDAMGISQPKIEDLVRFFDHELSLVDLIGAPAAKGLVFH